MYVRAGLAAVLSLTICQPAKVAPPAPTQTYTFKALSGISMGAIGSSLLTGTGQNHTKIDALAAIGGPLDVGYFLSGFERMQVGGWCPMSQLVALGAADIANHTNKLNDPTALSCPMATPRWYEHEQDFNNWQFTVAGGTFDRSQYLDLFYDLSLALGNPLYYNPESPIFPVPGITRANMTADICTHPMVFSKANGNPIYNAEFNPNGDYPVVTVCDGQDQIYYCNNAAQTYVDWCQMGESDTVSSFPQTYCSAQGASGYQQASVNNAPNLFWEKEGKFNPCWVHNQPSSFGVAVDYNNNGQRDYFEPIIVNGHERFTDTGTDGCLDDQEDGKGGCTGHNMPGDPNGDNFDPVTNPMGTQGNFIWDKGEPFEDNGLDGVANTHDYGEGDGVYTDGPNRKNWFAQDFRTNFLKWSPQEQRNLAVYADGGIRDVFNLGLSADIVTSATRQIFPAESSRFLDFSLMPALPGKSLSPDFDLQSIDWSKVGRNAFVRYGNPDATIAAIRGGDGDHLGPVVSRLEAYVGWLSREWSSQPQVGQPAYINDPNPLAGSASPIFYQSKSLNAPTDFWLALPPGYNIPENANRRYPVISLGHGYGMTSASMAQTAAILTPLMSAGVIVPMIFAFPNGHCCFVNPDGTKDCRDTDPNSPGNDLTTPPGAIRECSTGSFYVNRQGFTPGDTTAYGDAVFEMLDYIDKNYRTLAPATVPIPGGKL